VELKTLLSILSIFLGLLGNHNVIGPGQAPPTNDRDLVQATVEVSREVPPFVRNVPGDPFVPIDPVTLCSESAEVKLQLNHPRKGLSDQLLGAILERTVVLSGQDEIGRPVHTKLTF